MLGGPSFARVPLDVAGVGVEGVSLHPKEDLLAPLRGTLAVSPLQSIQLGEVGPVGIEHNGVPVGDDRQVVVLVVGQGLAAGLFEAWWARRGGYGGRTWKAPRYKRALVGPALGSPLPVVVAGATVRELSSTSISCAAEGECSGIPKDQRWNAPARSILASATPANAVGLAGLSQVTVVSARGTSARSGFPWPSPR